MKRNFWFFLLVLLVLIKLSNVYKGGAPATQSANEESPHLPIVVTDTIVIISTPKEAMLGFEITDDGGGTITSKGVCWSTSQNPTRDNIDGMVDFNNVITIANLYRGIRYKHNLLCQGTCHK